MNAPTKDAKYIHETNKFTKSNAQIWEIRKETDCHSVNDIYYLECKMRNKKKHILRNHEEIIRRDLKLQ